MSKKKFFISGNYPDRFTASGKAKIDVEEILCQKDFFNVGLKQSRYKAKSFKAYLRLILSIGKIYGFLKGNGYVLIQHPRSQNLRYIKLAKRRNLKVVVLIHDLNSLRDWDDTNEKEILNAADILIVHTEAMRDWLKSKNIGKEYVVLELFDYLHASQVNSVHDSNKYQIAFAGNLGKSQFIDKLNPKKVNVNLYGIGIEKRKLNSGVEYKGCFPPDKLAENIIADFGLVWDGDDIDTCGGQLGEYLRLISPHKLSMYLSSGLPVIVWKQSAMAPFVEKHDVGITIESLSEIDEKIANMSNEDYDKLRNNVSSISKKLSAGYFMSKAVENAQRILFQN